MSTTAQIYQEKAERTMKRVCRLLHWTEEQFAENRYRNGVAYLYWYLPTNDGQRDFLERNALYWKWWRTVCDANDEAFTDMENVALIDIDTRHSLYEALHCPRTLVIECKPNSVVLDELKKRTAC